MPCKTTLIFLKEDINNFDHCNDQTGSNRIPDAACFLNILALY